METGPGAGAEKAALEAKARQVFASPSVQHSKDSNQTCCGGVAADGSGFAKVVVAVSVPDEDSDDEDSNAASTATAGSEANAQKKTSRGEVTVEEEFWFNKESGAASWVDPATGHGDYVACWDSATGLKFYYNWKTGASVWKILQGGKPFPGPPADAPPQALVDKASAMRTKLALA